MATNIVSHFFAIITTVLWTSLQRQFLNLTKNIDWSGEKRWLSAWGGWSRQVSWHTWNLSWTWWLGRDCEMTMGEKAIQADGWPRQRYRGRKARGTRGEREHCVMRLEYRVDETEGLEIRFPSRFEQNWEGLWPPGKGIYYCRSTRQFHAHHLRDHPPRRQYSMSNLKSIFLLMVVKEKECSWFQIGRFKRKFTDPEVQ